MTSHKGSDFLKQRAEEFWAEGTRLCREGKYNLAAFHIEQACQLFIKYLIGTKVGDWPRTHSIKELIYELSIVCEEPEIEDFFEKNELFFSDLEDAYFTSRYLPKDFTPNLVAILIENSRNFFVLLEKITGETISD